LWSESVKTNEIYGKADEDDDDCKSLRKSRIRMSGKIQKGAYEL